MAESIDRAYKASVTADALTHANTVIYTATVDETIAVEVYNNDASQPVDIEIAVDVAGTLVYLWPKAATLSPKTGFETAGKVIKAGDIVRVRASSNSRASAYVNRIKVA